MLSKQIRMELQCAIVGLHLLRHPLYDLCAKIDYAGFQCLCFEAVQVMTCLAGEVIFIPGSDAEYCYIVVQGQ